METVNSISSLNTNYTQDKTSNKKAALIGAGAGLGAGLAADAISIGYKAHQFVAQNKEKGHDVKFTDGVKRVWSAVKEFGNATVKDGAIESKTLSLGGKEIKGKYLAGLVAASAAICAGLGAITGVAINHYKNNNEN